MGVLVAWVTGAEREVRITGKVTSACDLMGRPFEATDAVTLSPSPVYLCGNSLGIAAQAQGERQ
jgi:hypothetical protein